MSDCQLCPVETACHYPYKPCDCVHQRKFWTAERRAAYEEDRRFGQPNHGHGDSSDQPEEKQT